MSSICQCLVRTSRDYLSLTIETVSRILWSFQRRGALQITGLHSIVLRNQPTKAKNKKLAGIFEGVKDRQPNSEKELQEWLASLEGKAATLFALTPLSPWGNRARS
jgi:hypothetical protein